jgi:hypothetical protein
MKSKYSFSEIQNGGLILLLLRSVSTWKDLCNSFEYTDPANIKTNTGSLTLYEHLIKMRTLGLLEFQGNAEQLEIVDPITITKRWADIQNVLGHISLSQLARLPESAGGMVVKPVLGLPNQDEPLDLFVAMPYTENLKPVYDNHIQKVCKKLGISFRRADDIFSPKPLISKIWDSISSTRLVLADCTGKNANVFYELGLAHILGKPVILITQTKDDMPVDIKHIEFLEYKYDPVEIKKFEKKLADILKKELSLDKKEPAEPEKKSPA